MKAEEATARATTTPTEAQGRGLATKMWKLLGSKTRHVDQLEDWMDEAWGCWQASEFTWQEFEKIVVWSLTENEFTVSNLRTARNPGESLFERQWENVAIFYDAAMAGKKARERKLWAKGACCFCDERPARQQDWGCKECLDIYEKVDPYVDAAKEQGLLMRSRNTHQWFLHETEDVESPVIAQGTYEGEDTRGHETIISVKYHMVKNADDFIKLKALMEVA